LELFQERTARHEFKEKLKNKHTLQKKNNNKRLDHHQKKENWFHQQEMTGASG